MPTQPWSYNQTSLFLSLPLLPILYPPSSCSPLCLPQILESICWKITRSFVLKNFSGFRLCWFGVIEHASLPLLFSLSWILDSEAWPDSGLILAFWQHNFIGILHVHWKVLNVCLSVCDINKYWSFPGCIISHSVQIATIASFHLQRLIGWLIGIFYKKKRSLINYSVTMRYNLYRISFIPFLY